MLPSCMELMGMLPSSTVVAALTLMMLATPPLTSIVAALTLMMPSTWARGIFLCGMALAINHLWRTRRTNETPEGKEETVSSHKIVD